MKKFLVFLVLIVGFIYWFKGFVQSGGFEKFLDSHPNQTINPAVEYYWGMMLNLANREQSAVYRLSSVVKKYPKSEYAPTAWIEYIGVLDNLGDRGRVLDESKKFLESDYSSHPRAVIIKKKVNYMEHGL